MSDFVFSVDKDSGLISPARLLSSPNRDEAITRLKEEKARLAEHIEAEQKRLRDLELSDEGKA